MPSTFLPATVVAAALSHPMVVLLLKATIILLAALGITLAMERRSAGARHLVWLVALAALLVVPAIAVWAPLRVEVLPPVAEQATVLGTQRSALGEEPTAETPSAERRQPSAGSRQQPSAGSRPAWVDALTISIAVWVAVVLIIGASLAWSALVVRRIVRRATALDDESWTTPLFEVADRLELDEVPRLLRSEQAKMPFACGLLAPTIVFPAECDGWSLDRRRAVLLHELAHVRRHDLLGHTLGRLACAVWWFHPLVWTAAKQLRAESERACDDLALSCGTRATDYAEHLLDIVTSVRRDATPAVALAMARRKEFEGRMLAILDPEARRATPGRLQTAALVASLGVIALVVGAAAPAPRAAQLQRAARDSVSPDSTTRGSRRERQWVARSGDPAVGGAVDRSVKEAVKSSVNEVVPNVVTNVVPHVVSDVVTGLLGRTRTETRTDSRTATSVQTHTQIRGGSGELSPESLRSMIREGQDRGKKARGPDDRPALLANVLKTDANPELRRIAAWGLSEYGDTQVAVEALSAALRGDKDDDVREMAAWALGEGGDRGAGVQSLADALKSDASPKVRETAAWALGECGDRAAVPALTEALGSQNAEIRRRAVWALGEIGPKQAPAPLVAMLKDSDPDVRELTAWALYEIEDPAAAPALQAALESEKNTDLQLSYIRALAAVGEKSVDAIRGLLESKDPRIKTMAVKALAGGDAAGPWPWPWPMPRPYP